jgi:hypothetical protein
MRSLLIIKGAGRRDAGEDQEDGEGELGIICTDVQLIIFRDK